jgi:N-acyl-D-amino-acid deacylase
MKMIKYCSFAVVVLFLLSLDVSGVDPAKYDLLIKGGRLVDGSGKPAFVGDLAIHQGKIVEIGTIPSEKAARVISAGGKVVAPGFIDVHTHLEESIKKHLTCDNFAQMGVTTAITGNCGGSAYPLGKWFEELEKSGVSINVGSLVGHNTARNVGMGIKTFVNRAPTPEELKRMEEVLEEGFGDGALGFSTGLIYTPGTYSKTDEIIALAKVAAKHHTLYVTHMRNEGLKIEASIQEALEIARSAGCPLQISHFKMQNKNRWGDSVKTIKMVEEARAKGEDVMVDQYLYTAGSTKINTVFPTWLFEKGVEDARERLKDPEIHTKVKKEMMEKLQERGVENYSYAVVAFYSKDKSFNGKSISEITELVRKKTGVEEEIEQAMDILMNGGADMIFHTMSNEDVENILQQPFTILASDAWAMSAEMESVPHPRCFGNNPRLLGRYVREKKMVTLEMAVKKMTSMPAQRFKIPNRGLLQQGYAADVVVFDPETITDMATFENPKQYPVGIDYVLVNGTVVVDHGKHSGAFPGKIIRKHPENGK